MKTSTVRIGGTAFPVHSVNTLVIGSGAAGLAAAVRLCEEGQSDVVIATGRFGAGASFNSGSDKQTYYKLSLADGHPDSPLEMARDLAAGGGMHGDVAYVEAVNSAEAFLRLAALGVPFPQDKYGAYVGYKTDNDPRQRATSAGPLTSRFMAEALAREAGRREIPMLDGHEVVRILTGGRGGGRRAVGAVALDQRDPEARRLGFVLFNAVNIILATGGPGGMYKYSVYPEDQTGAHGLGLETGATAQNLTESQFGLASVGFRWNLSGTYQQAVPRYYSTDAVGGDEREFLSEAFPDMGRLATAIFLKGYEWPFDPARVADFGSSLIDLLVYRETVLRGRRVFLDFRRNPSGGGRLADFDLRLLAPEARAYLERSGALLALPIDRLRRMNPPAVDLFHRHGIDLGLEPLECAICAQHANGGFKGNIWWESDVRHLFPIGEANGSHGVRRPGGAALNAGQVGAMRAARFIARRYDGAPPTPREFAETAEAQVRGLFESARGMIDRRGGSERLIEDARREIRERMSACAAHVRKAEDVARETPKSWALLRRLRRELRVSGAARLPEAFRILDQALTHAVYLEAVKEYLARGGKSRGSYIVPEADGILACPGFRPDEGWRFSLAEARDFTDSKLLEIGLDARGRIRKSWIDVRPVPVAESWFESVWNDCLMDRIVREEQ